MKEEREQQATEGRHARQERQVRRVAAKSRTSGNVPLVIIATALVAGYLIGARQQEIMATLAPVFGMKVVTDKLDLSSVDKTYRELKGAYDGDLDSAKLIDGASRGLTAAAGDPYTVFMDRSEAEEFQKDLSGDVGAGVGAEMGIRSGQPTVIRVIEGMPAEKAGVKRGDVIVGVNEESTVDLSLDKTVAKIRGEEGSTVKLIVKRGNEIKEFSIVRQKIENPSVRSETKDGVGILTISRFDTDTGDLARRAAEKMKHDGVRGVVVDVRDNGGGYVTAAQEVAGLWLNNKLLITEKRGGKKTDELKSRNSGTPVLEGMKTVVLINGGSASASEIIAGALQEYNVATVIGERSFGKGTMQRMIDLPDGRILKVTIARWYTPKDRNITKHGIDPNKKVELTAKHMDAGQDPQMDAAIGAL